MNSTAQKITIGEAFSDWAAIVGRNWQFLLIVGLVLGVVDGLVTYLGGAAAGAKGVFNLIAGYYLLVELLRRERLMQSKGSVWSYVGASLLAGVGIVIGLILLIVPGLYLMARWSLAPAIVLARGERAIESLESSWEATRESAWTLLLVFLLFFVVLLIGGTMVGFVIGVFAGIGGLMGSPLILVATQLLSALGSVIAIAFSVAIYHLLAGGTREYEEAFA